MANHPFSASNKRSYPNPLLGMQVKVVPDVEMHLRAGRLVSADVVSGEDDEGNIVIVLELAYAANAKDLADKRHRRIQFVFPLNMANEIAGHFRKNAVAPSTPLAHEFRYVDPFDKESTLALIYAAGDAMPVGLMILEVASRFDKAL
jgi:hypothetical protein